MTQGFENIDAGDLSRRIEIQVNTPTKDTKGQERDSWATIATRWASVLPASGQSFTASEQIRNSISHKVVIRYYPGLTPRNRILYGSRIFNILSIINEMEMGVRHTLLVTEVI